MYIANVKDTDFVTGEETSTRRIVAIKKVKADTFFQVYADNLLYFLEIEPASARKIAAYLFKEAKYDEGYVDVSNHLKKKICKELNIVLQTFRNGIKVLLDKKVIFSSGDDKYYINPNIAWRGTLQAREDLKNVEGFKVILEPVQDLQKEMSKEPYSDFNIEPNLNFEDNRE